MTRLVCVGFIFVLSIFYFIIEYDLEPIVWYVGLGAIAVSLADVVKTGNTLIAAERQRGIRSWRSYVSAGIIGCVFATLLGFCVTVIGLLHEYKTISYPKAINLCYSEWPEGCSEDAEGRAACVLMLVLPTGFLAGLCYFLISSMKPASEQAPLSISDVDKHDN